MNINIFVGHSSHTKVNKEELIRIFNRFKRSLNWSSNVSSPPVSLGEIPVIFMPSGFLQTFMNPLLSGFDGKNLASNIYFIRLSKKAGNELILSNGIPITILK